MTQNQQAFLDMIATSEGTAHLGDRDYNVLVGGGLFQGYADHPRTLIRVRKGLSSTAAGRYQLLARYYDSYKKSLHLPDFSPDSQDAIALQQIKESGALGNIERGELNEAIRKCAHIWTSFPGSGYGQHENSLAILRQSYP